MRGEKLAKDTYGTSFRDFNIFSNKSQEKRAKKLATERALDKYKFFVFGLTIVTTLY